MTCRADGLSHIISQRREAMVGRDVRVLTLWNNREHGTIPDMLSKYEMEAANEAVGARFAFQAALRPAKRARNCINVRGESRSDDFPYRARSL